MDHVPPYSTFRLDRSRIWMCRLTFAPPDRKATVEDGRKATEEDGHKTIFDKYMDGMAVVPLSEAYVILVPTNTGQADIKPDFANAMFFRTAKDGELLKIQESEIHSGVPDSESSRWQMFAPNSTMTYYWTLTPARFERVIKEARSDYNKAKVFHDFANFKVYRQRLVRDSGKESFELLKDRELTVSLLENVLMARPSDSIPGYFRRDLTDITTKWNTKLERNYPYVFARRRVADALYCGELAQCHALGLRQRSAKEFCVFSYARDICRKAKEHERVEELDEQAKDQSYRDLYYEYAYRCGCDKRVDADLFEDSLSTNSDRAEAAARKIAGITDDACLHPCFDEFEGRRRFNFLRCMAKDPVLNYFDYYRFGSETRVKRAAERAEASEIQIRHRLEAISGKVSQLMSGILYYDLFVCLGNYQDDDAAELHRRYLDLWLDVSHQWWTTFDPEKPSDLERLRPYKEDMGTSLDKVFGNVYVEHFKTFENIHRINHDAKRALELVKKMGKWNDFLKGEIVKLKDVSGFRVDVDLESGWLFITDGSKEVLQMRLLVEVAEGANLTPVKPPKQWTKFRGVSVKKAKPGKLAKLAKKAKLQVTPDYSEIHSWPSWLGVCGLVLSLTASVEEMISKFQEEAETGERVIAVAKVAKDTFQVVNVASEALLASFPYAVDQGMVKKFAKFGEEIRGPGLILEAVLNVHEGATILLLGEDSSSAAAIRKGDLVEASLLEAKGMLLVASAAPGTYAAGAAVYGGATAADVMAAALVPLGFWLAIAAIAVVGVNIAIGIEHGRDLYTKPIDEALEKANEQEFGEKFDKNRTVDSLSRFSETIDTLIVRNNAESPWQATTQSNKASTSH